MNNSKESIPLPVKYSNNMYATKQDIARDLKINLVDNIWDKVVEYRSNFIAPIDLKHIDDTKYNICLTPSISNSVNQIERKLFRLSNEYFKLEKCHAESDYKLIAYKECLNVINKKYNLRVEDNVIDSIITGNISALSPQAMNLNKYFKCLKLIEQTPLEDINDTCLGNFFSNLTGNDELVQFYRTKEIDSNASKYMIGKIYYGIPYKLIEKAMDDLFNFINFKDMSIFIKGVVTFYYLYYVRPFEIYSEDIGLLLFKKVLSHNDLGPVAAMINLESIFEYDDLDKQFIESQKTHDLTYFLNFILQKANLIVDKCLENIPVAKSNALKNEFYQKELQTIKEKENGTPKKEKLLNSYVASLEIPSLIDNSKQNKDDERKNELNNHEINLSSSLAFSTIPSNLSEEEAVLFQKRLIEMQPLMSESQAYFYARHCTVGMNYTIAQFKKALGCSYETARTSMDNLVYLGYYRKENLKNKYIYTPIKKN